MSPVAAPAVPGEYRCRIKIDWNNIDPKGIAAGQNNATIDNGGAIIDFTLKVLSPLQADYNALLAQAQADLDFAKSTESREMWNAIVTDGANIYSPVTETQAREPKGWNVAFLLDNDLSTYWHSSWAANVSADNSQHYLQFDLGQAYDNLQLQYQRRQGVGSDHPTRFLITGSNDGENFEEIKTIEVTGDADNVRHTWNIENETAYRYVRVRATMTDDWRGYWHAAEMNFYHYEFVKGANLYTKAGEIATQIEAILANPSAAPTQEDVDALQALCDQLHALIHDIDQYRGYPSKLNMYGGYKATDEQAAALAAAIENYDADAAAAVVATMTAVDNARTAFTLVCERGNLFAAEKDGATLLVSSNNRWEGVTCANEDDAKWAFVSFNGGTYLYNVGKQLFFNADRTLTATPDANAIAVEELNLNAAYPFVLKSGSSYFNTQVANNTTGGQDYDAGVVVNGWGGTGKWDTGNQYKIVVADDFDPAEAVEIIIAVAAMTDIERLEDMQADLTQFIASKEEFILADVAEAIAEVLGDSWRKEIYNAYSIAMENNAAYVSPDFWATLEKKIDWIKEQIAAVKNGDTPIYTVTDSKIGAIAEKDQAGKYNYGGDNASSIEVFVNHVVLKNFINSGSDLSCAYDATGAITSVAVVTEEAGVRALAPAEITVGEKALTFEDGIVKGNVDGGSIQLNFTNGYYFAAWGNEIATGINGINAVSGKAVYNLSGQRVNAAKSGLYIVGGQKVVVK